MPPTLNRETVTPQGQKIYFSGEVSDDEKRLQPTTITNATIREKVVPDLNARLNTLSSPSTYVDASGIRRDQSGNPVQAPNGSIQSASGSYYSPSGEAYGLAPEVGGAGQYDEIYREMTGLDPNAGSADDREYNQLLGQAFSYYDQTSKDQIQAIQQQAAVRRAELEDSNRRQAAGTQQALLLGGSSRYAPISSDAIFAKQERAGIMELADLDAQEQSLISQAKAARQSGNFQILEKALTRAEAKRKEKLELAVKLNDQLVKENKLIREKKSLAARDEAISSLVAEGITDTNSILQSLNKAGGDYTAKEVAETLKNIMPAGLDDLLKTLKTNGAPADVIRSVMSSSDIGKAYDAAGSYAAGGAGIVGEYNFYRAQAEAAGQVPLSFDEYQTRDANRKLSVANAAANVAAGGGLSPKQVTTFNSIVDKYNKSPLVAANDRAAILRSTSAALSADPTNSSLQVAFIYSLIQALDTYQSAVREGEIGLVSSAQGVYEQIANLPEKISGGSVLSKSKVDQFVKTAKVLTDSIQSAADKKAKTFSSQAKIAGIGEAFDEFVNDTKTINSAESIVENQKSNQEAVRNYVQKNPQQASVITSLLQQSQPELGRPMTIDEVFEFIQPR